MPKKFQTKIIKRLEKNFKFLSFVNKNYKINKNCIKNNKNKGYMYL